MLLARLLDGASGGNILVAQAYVADVTAPEDRARGMGLIGMAFGLGFVLGPLLGGVLLELAARRRMAAPPAVPGGRGLLDPGVGARSDPPSRVAAPRSAGARGGARGDLAGDRRYDVDSRDRPAHPDRLSRRFRLRGVRGNICALLAAAHALGRADGGVCVRRDRVLERGRAGGLDPPARPALWRSEAHRAGLCWPPADSPAWRSSRNAPELAGSMMLLGVGQGLLSPSVSGLLSRITPMSRQGAVFGTLTSAQTLARMISYSVSNVLLGKVSTGAPYWGAFGVELLALTAATGVGTNLDEQSHSTRMMVTRSAKHVGHRSRAVMAALFSDIWRRDGRQVAIEISADRLGVGVSVPGHHFDNFVTVGVEHLDRLDEGLGTCVQQLIGEAVPHLRTVGSGLGRQQFHELFGGSFRVDGLSRRDHVARPPGARRDRIATRRGQSDSESSDGP